MEAQIQNLRRRVAQGDPEAAVALLAARQRSGEVAWESVLLAAYLGDETAQAVAGRWARTPSKRPRRWARVLARFGEEAAARAVVRIYQATRDGLQAISLDDHHEEDPLPQVFDETVSAAEYWIVARYEVGDAQWSEEAARDVRRLARDYGVERDRAVYTSYWGVCWPLCFLTDVVGERASGALELSLLAAVAWLAPHSEDQAFDALRAVVSKALIAWCLG